MVRSILFAFLLSLLSGILHAAASPWQTNPQGQVRLLSADNIAPRQGTIYLGLQFKTVEGWNVYWKNPGDAGYAPRLRWDGSKGIAHPELLWPAPQEFVEPGDLIANGYTSEVVYPVRAETTGDNKIHAVAQIDYLTCREICVPHKYTLTLDLPAAEKSDPDPDSGVLIGHYIAQVPKPLTAQPAVKVDAGYVQRGTDAFFDVRLLAPRPVSPESIHLFFDIHPQLAFGRTSVKPSTDGTWVFEAAVKSKDDQAVPRRASIAYTLTGLGSDTAPLAVEDSRAYELKSAAGLPSSVAVAKEAARSLSWILLFALLGGLILNIMPCVLPVLSIKLFGLIEHSGESRRVIVRDALASAAGIITSFMGLALAAIVARHAGQAVGWGIQFQEPRFVAALAIIVMLFALNLWGVFEIDLPPRVSQWGAVLGQSGEGPLAYFISGLFATLLATPCSAPFLGTAMGFALAQPAIVIVAVFAAVGVGMALPYFLLAVVPRSLNWLPKPGAWMLNVRVVLGFLLAATAVWLGYVLSTQVDPVGLAYFNLGLVGVGFTAWLKGKLSAGRWRDTAWIWPAGWIVLGILACGMVFVVQQHRQSAPSSTNSSEAGAIAWVPFDLARIDSLVQAGTPVFVDVTAAWCFTCKYNEKVVLDSAEVAQAFQRRGIVAMRADWTNRDPALGQYLAQFGRYGIPFYAVYRPGKNPVALSEFLTKEKVLEALNSI